MIEVIRIQEALQKRCERTGLRQFQIWAVERCDGKRFDRGKPSTVAAVQKIPEPRSALQNGFEKTKKVVTVNGLPLVSTKKKCKLQ